MPQDNRPDAPSIGNGGTTETVVAKRTTPGVVGVLNYLIDDINTQSGSDDYKMSHGDSVLQCLNILYEYMLFTQWMDSEYDEAHVEAAEQLGIELTGGLTLDQENLLDALTAKLLLQRAPKFDLFSTTEEAVEYWMGRALQLGTFDPPTGGGLTPMPNPGGGGWA